MGMTIEEAKKLDHFLCSDCASEEDPKKASITFSASPLVDGKVKFLADFVIKGTRMFFFSFFPFPCMDDLSLCFSFFPLFCRWCLWWVQELQILMRDAHTT